MQDSTTMRVSRATHQELRERAAQDGVTLEDELKRLLRFDRQRRLAESLSSTPPSDDDRGVLRGGISAVARNLDAGR